MTFDPTDKEDCLMLDSSVIYRYIHGGDAEVTLVHPPSNYAHAYAFCKPKNELDFPEGTIFAYVLHNGHKMYLGMLSGNGFRRTQKSNFDEDTEAMKGVRYIVRMANEQNLVDKELMHLYHSGRCCCCGRKLSGKKSMKAGIGRKCLARFNKKLEEYPWDGN